MIDVPIEWKVKFGNPFVTTAEPEPGVTLKVQIMGKRGKRAAHVQVEANGKMIFSDYTAATIDPGAGGRALAVAKFRRWRDARAGVH